MDLPCSLASFSKDIIIDAFTTIFLSIGKPINLKPSDPKSVFGRVAEKITKQPSTYGERKYLYYVWDTELKDQEPFVHNKKTKGTHKHSRKKTQRQLNKKAKEVELEAECSLLLNKLKLQKLSNTTCTMPHVQNSIGNPTVTNNTTRYEPCPLNHQTSTQPLPQPPPGINITPEIDDNCLSSNPNTGIKRKINSPHKSSGFLKRFTQAFQRRPAKPTQLHIGLKCNNELDEQCSGISSLSLQHQNAVNNPVPHHSRHIPLSSSHQQQQNPSVSIHINKQQQHINSNSNNYSTDTEILADLLRKYNDKILKFPSFVCPICRRILYNNNFSVRKFTFTSQIIRLMREACFAAFTQGQTIVVCSRCNDIFKRNKIPPMIFLNKMEVDRCPDIISSLNDVEAKLISQIRPFMKIYHLSKGQGQLAMKGACIHFPQSVDEIVETLPLNKNSADLLIVNETSRSSSSEQQFHVRGRLLYEALHMLKEINPLYSNVTIDELPEQDLGIQEIRQRNVPETTNTINDPPTGYRIISNDIYILRGNISQASALFKGGNQSIAMSASAIAYSSIQHIRCWSSNELDNVILTGDQYFEKLAPTRNTLINIDYMIGFITCYNKIEIHVTVLEEKFSGFLNKVTGTHLTRLPISLAEFFSSLHQFAIVHVADTYLALVKADESVFLFDSFSRGPKGKQARNGTACIIRCPIKLATDFYSEHIHRNCQPSFKFHNNLSIEEKQKFQYSIIPVSVTQNLPVPEPVANINSRTSSNNQGYFNINENQDILRASFHQGSHNFQNGGNQCAAMSATAAAHTLIKPVHQWNRQFLDSLLRRGDRFYETILPNRNRYLEATELNGTIDCVQDGKVKCRVVVHNLELWSGPLDMVPGSEHTIRLSTSLEYFLQSDFNNAILTINIYCLALIKSENMLYIFDSHSRGPRGESTSDGTACVIRFHTESVASRAATFLNLLCQPAVPYSDDMDYTRRRHYTYRIEPILCRITHIPTNNEEAALELPPPQARPQNDICNNTERGQAHNTTDKNNNDIPTHENHLLLDCVVRADEPNQPTVQSFLNVCRGNDNEIPEVHLQRQQGRPLYPGIEKRLEELAFVKALPFGNNGCDEDRRIKITPLDYFQQRIMGVNKNFHTTEYLFYALSRVEAHIIQQKIAVCGNMVSNNGVVDNDYNINLPGLDNIHLYMSAIRGSGSYWKKYTGDVFGMMEQLGIPQFFITISYDDLNSVDCITALWKAKYGPDAELPCDPKDISYEERKQLLNDYPVAAARHFHNRMNAILELFKKQGEYIFGSRVVDFTYRVEFQGRGSPHIHMLIYTEFKPDWNTEEGLNFLNRNVSCSLKVPYADLVVRYQHHSHRSTCFKKHNVCRFGFPRKPSPMTKILDEEEINKSHGRFVELKRSNDEIMINNYHPILLQILKCNMDIQAVTGTRAIAFYIGKYMSKGEPTHLRQEIRDIINNFKADGKASYHRKAQLISNAIIKHREISAQEAAFRLLHLRLRNSSRSFVFVPSFQPQNRIRLLRRDSLFSDDPKTGLNIIDRYLLRPDSLNQLCLLEFAAWWMAKPNNQRVDFDKDMIDGEIQSDDETDINPQTKALQLKENKGFICKRKRHAVVRFPHFKPLEQTDEYLYSMILLHLPLRSESFIQNYDSLQSAFSELKHQFRTNTDDSIINPGQVEQITSVMAQLENIPCFNNENGEYEEEYNMFEEVNAEPLLEHDVFAPQEDRPDVPLEERIKLLTPEQMAVFIKVRSQILHGGDKRLLEIVHGSAGVGKSFVINILTDLIATLCPGGSRALIKAAPTGIASRNINGVTIHKAFSLGVEQHSVAQYMKLGGQKLEERRRLYMYVMFLFLDEFSMISYQVFRQIHLRCTEIFGNDFPFGNLNVILFGDTQQLAPPRGRWIFDRPEYMAHEPDFWKLFSFSELKVVMRQRRRDHFLEILQRLRDGNVRREDVAKLTERLLNPLSDNYQEMLAGSKDSLHLFPKVKQVDEFNQLKLNELQQAGQRVYRLRAYDTYGSGIKFGLELPADYIFQDIRKCAGIQTDLNLCINARVTLKWNIDPLAGLCNGSMGTLRKFNWSALRRDQLNDGDLPESVLVQFDDTVAQKYLSRLPGFENCTTIATKTFEFIGKRGIRVQRKQIPLSLSFATTIHKSQGMSLNACTIHLGKHIFAKGQAYVAMSRVRTFEGLYITEIEEQKLMVNKRGVSPADPKPQREIMRLRLIAFLELPEDNLDQSMLNSLITFCLEYVMCSNCKYWECACICSNAN